MYTNFISQIQEDINNIRDSYFDYDNRLQDDQYAFVYWILMHLFNIDENIASTNIIEYKGNGVDCFVHYEETKELYIIQGKFHPSVPVKRNDILDFLYTPILKLKNREYTKCLELQDIFTNAINDSEYNIYLQLYVADNKYYNEFVSVYDTQEFHEIANVNAEFFNLDKIKNIYFGERHTQKIEFSYNLPIKSKDYQISLNADNQNNMVTSKYLALSLTAIYNMYIKANENNYDLFDENIRNFLGVKGRIGSVNKRMKETLKNVSDRQNFFLYNNGITIICDEILENTHKNKQKYIPIRNPKIVNGCQTTNTIVSVIKEKIKEGKFDILSDFEKTYVLTKLYQLDRSDPQNFDLYQNIVMYTNSQTPIKMDDFFAREKYFLYLQKEFEKLGFLLLVKKSDTHTFEEKYSNTFKQLKGTALHTIANVPLEISNVKDLFIPMDKLLKLLIAFKEGGYTAFKFGSQTLKQNSKYYKEFSCKLDNFFTIKTMIHLYIVFFKAGGMEHGRKTRDCVPYYLLDFLGHKIDKNNINEVCSKISFMFSSEENFNIIFNKFKFITEQYSKQCMSLNHQDYSTMTKNYIDYDLVENNIESAKIYAENNIFNKF